MRFSKFLAACSYPKYVNGASSQLQIVMEIAHLLGRYFSGFFLETFSFSYQFHSQSFHGFFDKLYDFVGYFETVYNPALRDQIVCLLVVNSHKIYIFRLVLLSLRMCGQNIVDRQFLLFACGILSALRRTARGLWMGSKFPPWFKP